MGKKKYKRVERRGKEKKKIKLCRHVVNETVVVRKLRRNELRQCIT